MDFRILLSGAGRRVELVQAFKQSASQLGVSLKVFGVDMRPDAPALAFCDSTRLVCSMHDESYIPQLIEICSADDIDLLIPTIDTDLQQLARSKPSFEAIGTRVMISSPEMISKCRDKNVTADFFQSCGLQAPQTVNDVDDYDCPFPCFIKPKDGSSSIGANRADSADELRAFASQLDDYVVQPFVEGDEYTVDIFCDFEGSPVTIVPRRRLAVRAGEVLKTRIDLDGRIIDECERLVETFRPCGPITVQLIRDKRTGEDYYIEINPRFGGGAPLSMKAGADSAGNVLRLLRGERLSWQISGIADGAVYSRFDQSVCVDFGIATSLQGIVFDLDDTLYPEKEYVRSGFDAVASALPEVDSAASRLRAFFEAGKPAIDCLLEEEGLPDMKQTALAAYRNCVPNIALSDEACSVLSALREKGLKLGVITDGRPEGQRAKIAALGLEKLVDDVIITDELGGEQFRKPNDIAFRIMQRRWGLPFGRMAYVGDNPSKDFQAPRQLGMASVWLKGDGLYANPSGESSATWEIESLAQVLDLVE